MEILGIGPTELLFVILIAILVMGPEQMRNAGRIVARWTRTILMSDALMAIRQVSRETRKQWTLFIREANDDLQKINPANIVTEPWQNKPKFSQFKAPPKSISTNAKPEGESSNPDSLPPERIDNSPQPLTDSGSTPTPDGESNTHPSTQTD